MVEGVDAHIGPAAAVFDRQTGVHDVVGEQAGVIDLQEEAGVDDGVVLLAHGVGDGVDVLLLGGVVLVAAWSFDIGGGAGWHEDFFG